MRGQVAQKWPPWESRGALVYDDLGKISNFDKNCSFFRKIVKILPILPKLPKVQRFIFLHFDPFCFIFWHSTSTPVCQNFTSWLNLALFGIRLTSFCYIIIDRSGNRAPIKPPPNPKTRKMKFRTSLQWKFEAGTKKKIHWPKQRKSDSPKILPNYFKFFQILANSFEFFQILSNSFEFFQILSNSFGFFQILSNSFKFFQILSNSFVSFEFFQILPNSFEFFRISPNPLTRRIFI